MRWLTLTADYAHVLSAGTELFVHRCNRALVAKGVEVTAAFYRAGDQGRFLDGVRLAPLGVPSEGLPRLDRIACRPHGLEPFEALLREVRPDVVHVNAFGSNASLEHLLAAKASGAGVALTYHSAGFSCQQTVLLEGGAVSCDGRLDARRCARCCLQWLGLPSLAARAFGSVDLAALAPAIPGKFAHPFERLRGSSEYIARWQQSMRAVDVVTYGSEWIRELLILNGVDQAKLIPLGLPPPDVDDLHEMPELWGDEGGALRILFAGRFIATKGVHLLLQALSRRPEAAFSVLLLGAHGPAYYREQVESLARADKRIRILYGQPPSVVLGATRTADAVVVPSTVKETGPYAVLEAQWFGTPVIGARLGGIPERLRGYERSYLFEPNDVEGLTAALDAFVADRALPRARFDRTSYRAEFDSALGQLRAILQGQRIGDGRALQRTGSSRAT